MDTLFPLDRQLEIETQRPLTQTTSLQVFVQLAEPRLFVQGFDEHEYTGRPPTLLRGALVLRVLKTSRLRSVTLNFKGVARTEWPEGIPPKKHDYAEENVLVQHTWPFFNQNDPTSGADIVRNQKGDTITQLGSQEDVSSLNLETVNPLSLLKRVASPSPEGRKRSSSILSSFGPSVSQEQSHTSSTFTHDSHFVFQPGDYIYKFEHPVPSSSPETIEATFGSVSYSLTVDIERPGAFKSNISTSLPVNIIRGQSDDSVEDSEPIAISRDWEDQLHYDIVIASKAMILNAYIPIAFKLIPLDKIKLHRIRIYVTENLEYYCHNKKVHRMEPVKKFLLLEHKAPPPLDLPPNADAKAKKMGNLLTSDGYDLTAKEFEFQVYVPEKLNNLQKLHPNTSYANIKSHHWIKICLRLSRMVDGKPKHYEISIDSPIHILSSLCSHANTLLPAYGAQPSDAGLNHESNIYFPKDVLPSSPPLSPEVEAIDSTPNSIYLALGGNGNTNNARVRSNSTLNHSLPNFESTLSANVYKPDRLKMELTSPQAVPLSPNLSATPLELQDSTSSPPAFDEIENLSNQFKHFKPLRSISPMPSLGQQDAGLGIDAIMGAGSPPLDPPSYDEFLQEEVHSPMLDAIRDDLPTPNITLTRSSNTPNGSIKSAPLDDGDLGDGFQFSGISPNMPESIIRSTSPSAQRTRANVRSASPRSSFEGTRSELTLSGRQHLSNNNSNDLDAMLNDDDEEDDRGREPEEYLGEGDDQRYGRSGFSSRSSISPSSRRTSLSRGDFEEELTGMEPLLQTTSTASFNPSIKEGGLNGSRFESRESLVRRESASVDITQLYHFERPFEMGQPIQKRPTQDKRPSIGSRKQSINPVMSSLLNADKIEEESKSEESSIKDNNSSSTITSTNNDDQIIHQKYNINNQILNNETSGINDVR